MKRNLTIILISTALLACVKENKTESKSWNERRQKMEYSFSEYSDKIPQIILPLSSSCDIELKGSRLGFTNQEISKFGTETSEVYGKLADKEKFTAIIYLYPADVVLPIIQTTDKKGNKISRLDLYENYCNESETSLETSAFIINEDLSIQLTDTLTTFDRNENDDIIESTKKTTVSRKQFRINENGKIIEQKTTP